MSGLTKALIDTLGEDDPVICRVRINKNQQVLPKVRAKKLPNGSMVSGLLEDMYPHLSSDEIKRNIIQEKNFD